MSAPAGAAATDSPDEQSLSELFKPGNTCTALVPYAAASESDGSDSGRDDVPQQQPMSFAQRVAISRGASPAAASVRTLTSAGRGIAQQQPAEVAAQPLVAQAMSFAQRARRDAESRSLAREADAMDSQAARLQRRGFDGHALCDRERAAALRQQASAVRAPLGGEIPRHDVLAAVAATPARLLQLKRPLVTSADRSVADDFAPAVTAGSDPIQGQQLPGFYDELSSAYRAAFELLCPEAQRAKCKALLAGLQLALLFIDRSHARKALGISGALDGDERSWRLRLTELLAAPDKGWCHSYLNQASSAWRRLQKFQAGAADGDTTVRFQRHVDTLARTKWKRRHSAEADLLAGSAAGRTARTQTGRSLRFLGRTLHFPVDTTSTAAKRATAPAKRKAKHHEAWSAKVQLTLEEYVSKSRHAPVVAAAAGLAACGMFGLSHQRQENARLVTTPPVTDSASGGVVEGLITIDQKSGCEDGIPIWTSANGFSGSRHYVDALAAAHRNRSTTALLLDDDSKNGDPFNATCIIDRPRNLKRSTVALRSLVRRAPHFCPAELKELLKELTVLCGKGVLTCIGRACFDKLEILNETGKWSGSFSQTNADPNLATALTGPTTEKAPQYRMPITYSEGNDLAGAGGSARAHAMERQISRARWVARRYGIAALPDRGGWELMRQAPEPPAG